MGAPKDWLQTFPFCLHIHCVCLETGEWPPGLGDPEETEEGVCSPLPLCHSFPFAVWVLPASLLPTLSLNNRRASPGGTGTAKPCLSWGPKCGASQRLLDGALNEKETPHLLSQSIDNSQNLSGQDPSNGWGRRLTEGSLCS